MLHSEITATVQTLVLGEPFVCSVLTLATAGTHGSFPSACFSSSFPLYFPFALFSGLLAPPSRLLCLTFGWCTHMHLFIESTAWSFISHVL